MKRLRLRLLLAAAFLLAAAEVDAACWRYNYRVYSTGGTSATRIPQFIVCDTEANRPATLVADGDLVYTQDTDILWLRAAAAWVDITTGGAGAPDIDSVTGQANWGTAATKETNDLIINGVEVDFEAGAAEGYPRLAQSATPPAGACDDAAETGRLYFDTDADTDGSLFICRGAAGWKDVDDDGGAGGGAPADAQYWVATANGDLSAERDLGLLTTGLVLNTVTAAVGVPSTYAGSTPCAVQFVRSINASGVTTCESIVGADLPNPGAATRGGVEAETCGGTDKISAVNTDGTVTCSADVAGGGSSHELLSATHTDTTAATVVRGDVVTGQAASPLWKRLALGTTGRYLRSDGTDLIYSGLAAAGVGTCTNQFVRVLNDNAGPTCSAVLTADVTDANITYAKVQDISAASKLLGRGSAAGAGDVEEITLGTNLSMSGTTINASGGGSTPSGTGYRHVTAGVEDAAAVAPIPIGDGGTTETASTEDAVLVGASTTDWVPKVLPACTDTGGNHLNYDQATNTFSCGTSGGSVGGGWTDGGTTVGLTTTTDFVNAGDNVGIDTAPASDKALSIATGAALKYPLYASTSHASYPAIFATNLATDGYAIMTTADKNWLSGQTVFGGFINPISTVDVNGSLGIRRAAIGLANGDNNNIVLSGNSYIDFSGPTGAFAVTGFTLGVSGRVLVLDNTSSQVMTLKHENASSTAANRISVAGGADIVADRAVLIYNSNGLRWKVVAYTPSGGGGAPTTATYITQTADAGLSAEQALSSLATGYMKVTTGTGVVSSQAVPIPIADGGTGSAPASDDQVLVSDSTVAATWRSVPNCTVATQKLLYATATNTWSCQTDATGGAGGGNSAAVTATLTSVGMFFTVPVTAAWATPTTVIVCRPHGGGATTVTPETLAVAGVNTTVGNVVDGVGFDVMVSSPYGLEGDVEVHCLGV